MIISLIAAMSENRVIGRDNAIPWRLPDDLKRFREITTGHPVIMGRKTFESIGKSLPDRKNIVITRNPEFHPEGCIIAGNLRKALAECADADEAFICGGGEIFRAAMPLADRIYLTVIHEKIEGDTYFPAIPGEFSEISRIEAPAPIPHAFVIYEKKPFIP
ncbi:MAG TPA: dihydrofolate reductase [Geobacteraceae bacterium]|nr:dihydrofolate reductase [Geobacteraceae bacterium]